MKEIKEFAMAQIAASENPEMLLRDHSNVEECERRMERLFAAEDALEKVKNPPQVLQDFLAAAADPGCTKCMLSSKRSNDHPECTEKIARFFETKDALVEFGRNL